MNILIANTQEFNPRIGGVEKISTDLAQALIDMGHSVKFVACIRSPYSQEYNPIVQQLILPSSTYLEKKNIEEFSKYIIENNIEIVLNQAGNILEFTELCAKVTKISGIFLITTIHINPLNTLSALKDFKFSKLNKKDFKPFIRMILYPYRYFKTLKSERKKYKEIVNISNKIVLLSGRYLGELQFLIGKSYNYKVVDIANFTTKCKVESCEKKEKTILFVGRLDFGHKRPDRIVEIWEKIYNYYPDWSLKIAGDGSFKEQLINYTKKRKIKNIEFLGFCDVDKEYEKAEILCMTSTIEGFPMVLIEASIYGCIPIAFNSFNSLYDVIDSGKNGYIVPAYSKRKYIKILRTLIENDDLRKKIRKETLNINKKFAKEIIVKKWIDLFNEVKK